METRTISTTPTNSTTAYTAGDQFGGVQTLSQVMHALENDSGLLRSVSVIDKESTNSAFDLLFFSSSPTVASSDNAALDISDAELEAKFLGKVSVVSGDYISLANGSVASVDELEHALKADASKGDLFMVAMIQGAPTFTLTDAITFKLGFSGE